jgi:peptidoglycan/LPS O-acetylase OafA/YrhL
MADRREHFYHYELDILRFGAFFMVYLGHALPTNAETYLRSRLTRAIASPLAGMANAGTFGVDLFFALSAYLITELLLREYRKRGTVAIRDFYVRRILRIWPLYLFVLLLLRPVLNRISPDVEQLGGKYLLGFLLFSGNWVCAFLGWPHTHLALLWSVSIEEQFYLSWPLVVKHLERYLGPICGGLIVVAFVMRAVLVLHNAPYWSMWCNTLARLDPIAGGALLAVVLRGKSLSLPKALRLALAAGGLFFIFLAGWKGNAVGLPALWTFPLVALGCVMTILGVLQPSEAQRSYGRVAGAFVYLGRISYGLYVYHGVALYYATTATSSWSIRILGMLGSMALTLLAAAASYQFLELPFLRLKRRFSYVLSAPDAADAVPVLK